MKRIKARVAIEETIRVMMEKGADDEATGSSVAFSSRSLPPWYANGRNHSSMAFMSRIAGPVGERTETASEGAAAPDGHFRR